MMCTEPSAARSRRVRTDRFSTVPDRPDTVTASPTCIAFSSSRKMPVIRSRTSVCEPKPIATPTMPAPASSGPMFTPISDSTIMPATITMVIDSVVRSSGSSVRSRAERAACASRASRARWRSTAGIDRLPNRHGQQHASPRA